MALPKGYIMNSQLLHAANVIVQGMTGRHGTFHTKSMLEAGTKIIAGTSPGKAGQQVHGVPVYDCVADIQKDFLVNTSVIFVPPASAKAAVIEAIQAGIKLIVVITEGIPVHDMLTVRQLAAATGSTIIGPNCPGILLPGVHKLGIIPTQFGRPGPIGIVSRSGTLTYEAMAALSGRGIGQRYVIGIGGDRVKGVDFIECLALFEADRAVELIVLIGEIGGTSELLAADHIAAHVTKPVYAYVAGHHAPAGVQLGHAGAILGGERESAAFKTAALAASGAVTAMTITALVERLAADV